MLPREINKIRTFIKKYPQLIGVEKKTDKKSLKPMDADEKAEQPLHPWEILRSVVAQNTSSTGKIVEFLVEHVKNFNNNNIPWKLKIQRRDAAELINLSGNRQDDDGIPFWRIIALKLMGMARENNSSSLKECRQWVFDLVEQIEIGRKLHLVKQKIQESKNAKKRGGENG